jgi:transposase
MLFPLAGGDGAVIKLGELVMILDLHRQGLSVSAIARQLGIDRKTVRRAIAKGLEPPKYKARAPRSRITDPFEAYLKERLAAYPGLTAVRLWRELKERGYAGGYSVLRDCVRDLRPPRSAAFEVRSKRRQANKRKSTSPISRWSSPTSPGSSASFGCFPWCSATPG